jgi:hypothetical protein
MVQVPTANQASDCLFLLSKLPVWQVVKKASCLFQNMKSTTSQPSISLEHPYSGRRLLKFVEFQQPASPDISPNSLK